MAAPKENQNAKGNKGGGRKTAQNEELKALVVNQAWDLIADYFNGTKTPQKITLEEIAIELVKKTAPKNIDLTTKGEKITGFEYVKPQTKNSPDS